MRNKGLLIQEHRDPRDWYFGGVSGIDSVVLQADGNWTAHRPVYEPQNWIYGDTMACVTFSALNCLEYMYHNKFGIEVNFNDRFTAKISGTTGAGNSLEKVAETIRTTGLLYQDEYPFDASREARLDWDDYYQEIPTELVEKAKTRLEFFETQYQWVTPNKEALKEALKYSPVQIGILYASKYDAVDGVIPRKEGRANHAVTLEWIDDEGRYHIFDHYPDGAKVLASDYDIQFAMAHHINKKVIDKPMPTIQLENNTLVQLVEGKGGFGMVLDDKIIIDELDKVLATWIVRNNGNTDGKVKPLTQAQWDSFPKINLKKEDL